MWTPTPGPQADFVACGAKEAFYGGSAGGGKSSALLILAARHYQNHHYRALLLRNTEPELNRTLIADSKKIYYSLGGKYNVEQRTWSFPGDGPPTPDFPGGMGGIIEFGILERDDDVQKYQGIPNLSLCAFDELTHFTEYQYRYMFSRLRSAHGLPCIMRATSNPGSAGHDWVVKRFAPWLYPPDHPDYRGKRAKPQERLWFQLADDDEEDDVLLELKPGEKPPEDAYARVYFPAKVSDNPYYAGTDYERNLARLPPLERKRLRDGDWMAQSKKGEYFKREWFDIVEAVPAEVDVRIRYWDRASSKKPKGKQTKSKSKRRDHTAGIRLVRLPSGLYIVEDMRRMQERPHAVKQAIITTTKHDLKGDPSSVLCGDPNCYTFCELDPSQAGQAEMEDYMTTPELQEAGLRFCKPLTSQSGDSKLLGAKAPSAQAEARNIKVLKGPWNQAFFDELEDFPEGHDDQVDVLAGAMRQANALSGFRRDEAGCTILEPAQDDDDLDDDEDDDFEEDEDDASERLAARGMSAENVAYWKSWGGTRR